MRVSVIVLLFLILSNLVRAQDSDGNKFRVVKDLRSDLLVYDPDFNSYVPYNTDIHYGTNFITVQLDTTLIRKYPLTIYLSNNSALFLDNKLYKKSQKEGWRTFQDSHIKKAKWLTIFNSQGSLPFNKIFYGFEINEKIPLKTVVNKLEARPSFNFTFQNFFIIIFLLILVLLAICKIYNNKSYNEFYNISRNTLAISKDQNYIFKKPLNSNNLLSLFVHCLIFVFIFFIIQYFTGGIINLPLFNRGNSLKELLINYISYTSIAFLVYILKFILIAFISYLYNVREYKLVHYFNFVKLSMLFYLFILPLVSLIYLWQDKLHQIVINSVVLLVLIGFSIVKIVVITYNLNKIRQFRNLYLFSYLCATEIIPLFIVFKLLI